MVEEVTSEEFYSFKIDVEDKLEKILNCAKKSKDFEEFKACIIKECPGSKIRSEGKGLGLGFGKGKGSVGVPFYKK
jgi:hypothetical protein